MTIHRDRKDNTLTFECDGNNCTNTVEYGIGDDFLTMIEDLKGMGWKIFKDADDWMHMCKVCR